VTKSPQNIILKEEKFILAHGFRDFNLWLACSIALGLSRIRILRQRKLLTSWQPGSRKSKRSGIRYTPQDMSPENYFLQLGLTPTVSTASQSIQI
jgi:hypothetical protein